MSEIDMEKQEEMHNEIMDVFKSGEIIEEKDTIENIFKELRELEGRNIDSFEEDIMAKIYLVESQDTSSVVSLENAYLRMIILLEDGNILIPKGIMSNSKNNIEPSGQIEYIKVRLPDKLKKDLEKLAKV